MYLCVTTSSGMHMNAGAKYFSCKHAPSSPHFHVSIFFGYATHKSYDCQSVLSFQTMGCEKLSALPLSIFAVSHHCFRSSRVEQLHIPVSHSHRICEVYVKLWRYALSNKLKLFRLPLQFEIICAWIGMHGEERQVHEHECKASIGKCMKINTLTHWPALYLKSFTCVNFSVLSLRINHRVGISHRTVELGVATDTQLKFTRLTHEILGGCFCLHAKLH